MKLFDEFERDYMGRSPMNGTTYDFLNRSAQPQYESLRDLLEGWLSRYPEAERSRIARHFRNGKKDFQHKAALFELFLHELLVRAEYDVTIEPTVANGKRPDFHATHSEAGSFYLEATLAMNVSEEEQAATRRLDDFYEAIDTLNSPHFSLNVEAYDWAPKTPLPISKIRRQLQSWVDSLDVNAIRPQFLLNPSFTPLPYIPIEHDGEVIFISAMPKSNPGGRALGSGVGGPIRDNGLALRNAIEVKRSRYGELHAPYIIGVNDYTSFVKPEELCYGLFGAQYPVMLPNVSGVLVVVNLQPPVWLSHLFMVPNPTAKYPVPSIFDVFPHLYYRDGKPEIRGGKSILELLGLPESWPHVT